MKAKSKEFLLELAELLDKHGANIEARPVFVPWEEQESSGLEIYVAGERIDLDADMYASTLRELAK